MPKGPRVFLTNSGRVWATALRPVPPKKRSCAIHARKVGRASNTADQSRSEPLQVSGSASAGRVICGTDLAGCVSVPGDFLRPQGAFPPGFYLLREGWVHCPAPEAPLTRGMPKGPRVFLTNSGRVWATAMRPVPPKKRPCAIHARKVGRASNTADQSRSDTSPGVGQHIGRPCYLRHGSGRVCLGTWRFPSASGGLPPRLLPPFEGGWVHCPAPEAPLTRGMPKGPRVFLTNSGRVWATALRPVPPKKRPCAIHARKVGRASNTADQSRSDTSPGVGQHIGRPCYLRHGSGRVCLGTWRFPSASGGLSPRLLPPFEGGWVHCPAPEAPLTRGMPKGPRVFLTNSGRVWATALRPVPPKKKALCHTCP